MNDGAKKSNRLTIIIITTLFVSPLFLSWYSFNYTDVIKMRGASNHGDLIIPPRPLDDVALVDPFNLDRNDTLQGKWSLIYISETCDKRCMDNVYRLRQVHLAMGKHSLRVRRVLLLSNQSAKELKEKLLDFKGQQFINTKLIDTDLLIKQFKLNETDEPLKADRIYIIDPLGNVMMSFKSGTALRDIYEDLKKLLRSSHIG